MLKKKTGAPECLSRLSIRFPLRSWSHSSWVWVLHQVRMSPTSGTVLTVQSLHGIFSLSLSLSLPLCLTHLLPPPQKNKIKTLKNKWMLKKKSLRAQKSFCLLCKLDFPIFTILEIKMEKLKILIHLKITNHSLSIQ